MWMVGGYNESSHHHHHHHHQVNLGPHDAFNAGRKLRPLIPRPPAAVSSTGCAATTHSYNFGLYTGSHLFSFNHHLGVGGEQGISQKNKEQVSNNGAAQVVMSTSRWNPTPEQLTTLEGLYRKGTRTPSTDQIQRITAELRRYGKIEGKNVFYWFQNHKARERQKRRRELELLSHDHHEQPVIEGKEKGPVSGKQGFETEETRIYYSTIDSAAAQETASAVSMQQQQRAAAKAGRRSSAAVSDHRSIGRLFHLDDHDQRNATWHTLPTPFCYSTGPTTTPPIVTCNTHNMSSTTTSTPPSVLELEGAATRRFTPSLKILPVPDTSKELYEVEEEDEDGGGDSATLQLFPLRSQVESEEEEEDGEKLKERDHVHFFEFLPPKSNN